MVCGDFGFVDSLRLESGIHILIYHIISLPGIESETQHIPIAYEFIPHDCLAPPYGLYCFLPPGTCQRMFVSELFS